MLIGVAVFPIFYGKKDTPWPDKPNRQKQTPT